jgi:hypothetical protein
MQSTGRMRTSPADCALDSSADELENGARKNGGFFPRTKRGRNCVVVRAAEGWRRRGWRTVCAAVAKLSNAKPSVPSAPKRAGCSLYPPSLRPHHFGTITADFARPPDASHAKFAPYKRNLRQCRRSRERQHPEIKGIPEHDNTRFRKIPR